MAPAKGPNGALSPAQIAAAQAKVKISQPAVAARTPHSIAPFAHRYQPALSVAQTKQTGGRWPNPANPLARPSAQTQPSGGLPATRSATGRLPLAPHLRAGVMQTKRVSGLPGTNQIGTQARPSMNGIFKPQVRQQQERRTNGPAALKLPSSPQSPITSRQTVCQSKTAPGARMVADARRNLNPLVSRARTLRPGGPATATHHQNAHLRSLRPAPAGAIQRAVAAIAPETAFEGFLGLIAREEAVIDQRQQAIDAARAKLAAVQVAQGWNRKRQAKIDAMRYNTVPVDYTKTANDITLDNSWVTPSTYRYAYENNQGCLPMGSYYWEYGPNGDGRAGGKRTITSGDERTKPRADEEFWCTDGGTHERSNAAAAGCPWWKWDPGGDRWWKWSGRRRMGHNVPHAYEYKALVMDAEVKLTQQEAKLLRDNHIRVPGSCVQ